MGNRYQKNQKFRLTNIFPASRGLAAGASPQRKKGGKGPYG